VDRPITGDHGQLASESRAQPGYRVADALGAWAGGREPLFRQLAASLAGGLASGAIGDRLPSERDLASALGVSRATVVRAYELLVDDGLLERRTGSGTFVARRPSPAHVCEDPLACVQAFFAGADHR
jgi:hypothetical protein